jgi:protein-tyrosine phosphatase
MTGVNEDRRFMPLAGGHNFRDLGGYATEDGRHVAPGRLFRSGTLAYLTDDDHEMLRGAGIRLICDLRTNRERNAYPTRWITAAATEIWAHDHDMSTADLVSVTAAPDPGAARAIILGLYRRLPYEQAPGFRELLARIAADEMPIVFHCSAGKDRTGSFAAILLALLEVDRATVRADYALSDRCYDQLCAMFVRDRRIHDLEDLRIDRIAPMLRADPAYLDAMFDEIERRHGTVEVYARDILGVAPEMLTRIRENLLV